MKKIIIAIFIIMFATMEVCSAKSYYNSKVNAGISMYKNKNYTECLQMMYEAVNNDPSNVLAYYYIAMSQARLGKVDKAKEAYQRVIDLNSSTQLSQYAQNGIECLDDSTKCRTKANLDQSKKALESVNQQMQESNMQSVKTMMNQNKNIQDIPPQYMKDFKDYSKPQNQIQNKAGAVPTKEEVADAFDVLKRAGYQNLAPQPAMTKEMLEMSMLNSMNGDYSNSYNPMMNYMPYMTQENLSKMDPQLLQTMMTTSMMSGF